MKTLLLAFALLAPLSAAADNRIQLPTGFSAITVEIAHNKGGSEGGVLPGKYISISSAELSGVEQNPPLIGCARILAANPENKRCGWQLTLMVRDADRTKVLGLERECKLRTEMADCTFKDDIAQNGITKLSDADAK